MFSRLKALDAELDINKILIILSFVVLASCGPSAEEKRQVEMDQQRIEQEASEKLAQEKANRIAAVTCSIMGETLNVDAAVRVREMNDAREKIGAEPFLRGDSAIQEALEFGVCQELVLNVKNYFWHLEGAKDAKQERERIAREKQAEEQRVAAEKRAEKQRIAAEKREEENKIAAEKRAEENRIAAEKQRIADSKPTVKEEFYSNGKSRSRTNYLPKSDGGKEHGLSEYYHENGQLMIKGNYKDGKKVGLWENYHDNGKLNQKGNFKDGKRDGLKEIYRENGQLFWKITFKDGNQDGIFDTYHNNGQLNERKCYNNGETTDMSYCEK